jgi:hypothetical protein
LMMHFSPLLLPLPTNNNIHMNFKMHKSNKFKLLVSSSRLVENIH